MNKRNIISHFSSRFKILSTNKHSYFTISSDSQHQNLISLLQSCKQPSQTTQIHCVMIKAGLHNIQFPLSKLLAHSSLQDVHYADSIFRDIKNPNLYMFNTMIRGYSVSDDPKMGLILFNRTRVRNECQDLLLDQFTFISVLKSCARLTAVWNGQGVHSIVLKTGFDLFLNVKNTLLHFYCVCRRLEEAREVFDELGERRDSVSWNALMGGFLCVSQFDASIKLFMILLYEDDSSISATTILSVLSAITETRNFPLGNCLHTFCRKVGFLSNLNVATALISMYSKHGFISSARQIFDETDVKKDVVLWNCLIDGYAKTGLLDEAFELLKLMKLKGFIPNSSTLAGLLSACSDSRSLTLGRYIHDYVKEDRLAINLILGTALVDMYAKSGLIDKAIEVFDKMDTKDVRCWTAMILGHGVHGQANIAISQFYKMEEEGFVPNEVTFLAVLSSCSHGGLVNEGTICFKKMVEQYKFVPKIEHYGCVIDLLGRAGLLDEAYGLIKGLPIEGDATAWRALLGACRVYGNFDLAERVKRELERTCGECASDSLALSGAYAVANMVPHLESGSQWVKDVDDRLYGKKEAGWSTIELSV